jgi:hypothetical protein
MTMHQGRREFRTSFVTSPPDCLASMRRAVQLAATLVERRDETMLYRQLATPVDTVSLEGSLEDLRFHGVYRTRFERWCDDLGSPG